jgi:hypothetical protein
MRGENIVKYIRTQRKNGGDILTGWKEEKVRVITE